MASGKRRNPFEERGFERSALRKVLDKHEAMEEELDYWMNPPSGKWESYKALVDRLNVLYTDIEHQINRNVRRFMRTVKVYAEKVNRQANTKVIDEADIFHSVRTVVDRVDKVNSVSYAIDPPDAVLLDDSIMYDEQTNRITVNIIDVTQYMHNDEEKEIIKVGAEQGTNLYLINQVLLMFPGELGRHILSMSGQYWTGAVIQISFRVHKDGRIVEPMVSLARIPPPIQMTYGQVDRLIAHHKRENENELVLCDDRCRECGQCQAFIFYKMHEALLPLWRLHNGDGENPQVASIIKEEKQDECAREVANREVVVGGLDHAEVDRNIYSISKTIVSEAAIGANCAVALFCYYNEIPVLYQGNSANHGSVIVSSTLLAHRSLGLPGYARSTSPGRRAIDLINCILLKEGVRWYHSRLADDEAERELDEGVYALYQTLVITPVDLQRLGQALRELELLGNSMSKEILSASILEELETERKKNPNKLYTVTVHVPPGGRKFRTQENNEEGNEEEMRNRWEGIVYFYQHDYRFHNCIIDGGEVKRYLVDHHQVKLHARVVHIYEDGYALGVALTAIPVPVIRSSEESVESSD